jgi:hypothetical protein
MATTAAPAADRFGVPLQGWSLASLYPYPDEGEGTLVTVACDQCGEGFVTDAPDDDTTCAVCLMPPAEVAALRAMVPAPLRPAACAFCGDPMYGSDSDGTRHPRCARFVASLAPHDGTEMEEPIAA